MSDIKKQMEKDDNTMKKFTLVTSFVEHNRIKHGQINQNTFLLNYFLKYNKYIIDNSEFYLINKTDRILNIDNANIIKVSNILGHAEDKLKYKFNGCTADILTGALISYQNGNDYVYIEPDTLVFNWNQEIQSGITFGRCFLCEVPSHTACSFITITHDRLLDFINFFLNEPKTDMELMVESKFFKLKQQTKCNEWQCEIQDRDNKIGNKTEFFYRQHLLTHELNQIDEIMK